MKVAILGGGPGALFAWYGAVYSGFQPRDVVVFAEKPTYPAGAFWLHKLPINIGTSFRGSEMEIMLIGSAEEYSRKQWGDVYPTSASAYRDAVTTKAYNPHVVLPAMWEEVTKHLTNKQWTGGEVEELASSTPWVICTFPITPEAQAKVAKLKIPVLTAQVATRRNICYYNGLATDPIVRTTCAFDRLTAEFPVSWVNQEAAIRALFPEVKGAEVRLMSELHPTVQPVTEKVIGERRNILLTGRWATLERTHLSHQSFTDTVRFFEERL